MYFDIPNITESLESTTMWKQLDWLMQICILCDPLLEMEVPSGSLFNSQSQLNVAKLCRRLREGHSLKPNIFKHLVQLAVWDKYY